MLRRAAAFLEEDVPEVRRIQADFEFLGGAAPPLSNLRHHAPRSQIYALSPFVLLLLASLIHAYYQRSDCHPERRDYLECRIASATH